MSKICTLFSSSSGNCIYISSGKSSVLVDAGVSCKKTIQALCDNGIDPCSIGAVFITHSHSDHVKGLRVLISKINAKVFASRETLGSLILSGAVSEGMYSDIEANPDIPLDIGVSFFRTHHDCPGSGGYVFTFPSGGKACVCTDLGVVDDTVRNSITGCKTVVIESNHDVGMLQNGSYPFDTKQRILSDEGHLSNGSCAGELPELVRSGASDIILAHLSHENNTPELAEITSKSVLLENGMTDGNDYRLYVSPPCGGRMIYI